jgi:spore germination cell wall hydrolase CwlJ-like protein
MRTILIATLVALITTAAASADDLNSKPAADPSAVECMAKVIYFEARGESQQGKIAVAKVVMNRVNSGGVYPNKVCDVVYQRTSKSRCQFTWTCRKNPQIVSNDMYEEARAIAEAVLTGQIKEDPSLGSTAFNNSPFPGSRYHIKIGHHYFYRSSRVQIASGD